MGGVVVGGVVVGGAGGWMKPSNSHGVPLNTQADGDGAAPEYAALNPNDADEPAAIQPFQAAFVTS